MTNEQPISARDTAAGRRGPLLAWQWSNYADAHTNRGNLLIHVLTNPLFMIGCAAIPASLAFGWWLAPAGAALVSGAMIAQGRGHAGEATPPAPFRGPSDVAARIFVEQWITFPRFVLSGRFLAAWRASNAHPR
jgi:hypothetical protein